MKRVSRVCMIGIAAVCSGQATAQARSGKPIETELAISAEVVTNSGGRID